MSMLGAKAPVHETVWQPQGACGESMSSEVTCLPNIHSVGLDCAENRAAMQRTTTIATPMHTHQAHWCAAFGRKRIELDTEEIVVSLQLQLRRSIVPIAGIHGDE